MLGQQAYYKGAFNEAIDLLTQEIALHATASGDLVRALGYRGRVYRLTGRTAEALADFSEALKGWKDVGKGSKPSDWGSLYFFAGCTYLAVDDIPAALGLFN